MDLQNPAISIEDQVRRHARDATVGSVVRVFEHTNESDNSNHEVSVLLRDGGKEPRRVPVLSKRIGEAVVPQIGDTVFIEFLDGTSNAPVVTQVAHNDANRAPLARAGHWRQEFGPERAESLYLEAETSDHSAGEPDIVRIAKKPDGLSDPSAAVEMDDSGPETTVRIKGNCSLEINVDGDVTLSAGGNIVLDEGGTAKKVATEDHRHDVTLTDGTSTSTSKPDDVTSGEIE